MLDLWLKFVREHYSIVCEQQIEQQWQNRHTGVIRRALYRAESDNVYVFLEGSSAVWTEPELETHWQQLV